MIYYITYFATKVLSWLYFPYKAKGTENIPRQGGFILASNHISNLDPVVLGICSVRRLNFMAKIELFKKEPLGFFLRKLGAFSVKRGEADFGALKEALKRLKQGEPVLIFVEGGRRKGHEPTRAQSGVGFIAIKSKLPIVPVYLKGTDKVLPVGSDFFKRGPVEAQFGKPFYINEEGNTYQHASQQILDEIYKLA